MNMFIYLQAQFPYFSRVAAPRKGMMKTTIAAALLLSTLPGSPGKGEIREFPLPTEGHRPQAIAAGPDGNVWVTEVLKHKILRVSPDGKIAEFPVPSKAVGVLQGIAAGADGNVWFTSREENMIRRMSPAGEFTGEFVIPSKSADAKSLTPGCWPRVIIPGPDGNLWFAEMAADKIGRITPKGEITEYPIPSAGAKPYGLAVGSDRQVWFTESGVHKIGRLDPKTGAIAEFAVPTPKAFPREIAAGADGNLWFTENNGNKIGRITPKGEVVEFPIPTPASQPLGIAGGPDGAVWFTEFKAGQIGRIAPDGAITEYPLPTRDGKPFCIAAGPDGNLWFALQANRVGRLTLR
jgi:virginiamycin B lyase